MSNAEPIDVAVDLALVAPEPPPILSLRQLKEKAPTRPPQLIDGMLHQGCKMVLSGEACAGWRNCSRKRMS